MGDGKREEMVGLGLLPANIGEAYDQVYVENWR